MKQHLERKHGILWSINTTKTKRDASVSNLPDKSQKIKLCNEVSNQHKTIK